MKKTKEKQYLYVKDYGDMLSQVKNKELVSFTMFGSYQGEWFAVLRGGDNLELWRGEYGSCSGCDFLEATADWDYVGSDLNYKITKEEAEAYFREEKPFLEVKEEVLLGLSIGELRSILPKKVLDDMYDFDLNQFYSDLQKVKKQNEKN